MNYFPIRLIAFTQLISKIVNKLFKKDTNSRLSFIKSFKKYPEVASINTTIQEILNGKSITRLGDGEFMIISGKSIGFQEYNTELASKLLQSFRSTNSNCIIGIPKLEHNKLSTFWINYWFENIKWISKFSNKKNKYYNLGVSRQFNIEQAFTLKIAWDNKHILFIYGEGSRFNENHELFDNAKSKSRILGTAKNSWEIYPTLKTQVEKSIKNSRDFIIICSLGPTATVLANEIASTKTQILDLGHLTNVYDKIVYGKKKPEEL